MHRAASAARPITASRSSPRVSPQRELHRLVRDAGLLKGRSFRHESMARVERHRLRLRVEPYPRIAAHTGARDEALQERIADAASAPRREHGDAADVSVRQQAGTTDRRTAAVARQRVVLLGTFTEYELNANDDGYDLAGAVSHLRERLAVPIYTGLPFGHVRDKLTLPIGGRCALSVGDGRARLRFTDYS